jgi:mono/diheme cytochrome c family protein
MFRRLIFTVLLVLFGNLANAEVHPIRDATRGELLYTTHCIACHSTQVHWREKKLVTNWASLQSQVQRWQGISGLEWSHEDIEDVARYLDVIYYRYHTPD